jgi:hypothetical protein
LEDSYRMIESNNPLIWPSIDIYKCNDRQTTIDTGKTLQISGEHPTLVNISFENYHKLFPIRIDIKGNISRYKYHENNIYI